MFRRKVIWLIAALLLLATGAFLMWDDTSVTSTEEKIIFPTGPDSASRERRKNRRQTLELLLIGKTEMGYRNYNLDPMMVALSGTAARGTTLVFELEDLRGTPVWKMISDCIEQKRARDKDKEKWKKLDFMEGVERVAVSDDLAMMEGDFSGVDLEQLFGDAESSAEDGVLYFSGEGFLGENTTAALWNDEMLLFSNDFDSLQEAIFLMEGKIPYDPETFPESMSYGEIFGKVDVDDFGEMFDGHDELAKKLAAAASDVTLHINAGSDVAIVADVMGDDTSMMKDLSLALGSALSLARLKAYGDEDDRLHQLLEHASVSPDEESFSMELALPLSYLEEVLGDCKWAGVEREPAPASPR